MSGHRSPVQSWSSNRLVSRSTSSRRSSSPVGPPRPTAYRALQRLRRNGNPPIIVDSHYRIVRPPIHGEFEDVAAVVVAGDVVVRLPFDSLAHVDARVDDALPLVFRPGDELAVGRENRGYSRVGVRIRHPAHASASSSVTASVAEAVGIFPAKGSTIARERTSQYTDHCVGI